LTKDFEEIVRSESPRVFRLLCRLLGRSEDLEDLAQEVFLRLFRAIPHFRGAAKLETYLYRIVINVAKDERRRLGHQREKMTSLDDTNAEWHDRLPSRAEHPIHALMRLDFLAAMEHGLTAVSDAERTCLVLFYQEGRSYEQIAGVLGLPVGTVKTHLYRGRLRLKEQAQQYLATRRKQETRT
jgi:RNA polymerase sigma-70 factor (ECF subfamily)